MDNYKLANILAVVISITGLLIIIGWIFDITLLKSITSSWATTKFSSALSFVFAGILLYAISKLQQRWNKLEYYLLVSSSTAITIIILPLLISRLLNKYVGLENLFINEINYAVNTIIPGMPSIITMVGFILIIISSIILSIELRNKILIKSLNLVILLLLLLGITPLIGYIFNLPMLYLDYGTNRSATSFASAILFILSAIGLFLARNRKWEIIVHTPIELGNNNNWKLFSFKINKKLN